MSDIVIKAENLGKKYLIGHQAKNARYVALRDVLSHGVSDFWRKTRDLVSGRPIIQGDELEEVWALKDVGFEIRQGEIAGIIGPNGAGKSTLLKLLSRITELSTGRITIKGRVASLLEVGTGFHPELTGRENIYLNGAILGMTRIDIKRKFDEIVAFSGVEKFIDTPVKRYSSGMQVRLAFAVAAYLEPEILLIDEVLSVGDIAFQKKSLGRMEKVVGEGRTVLFVSHNMGAVQRLCPRTILLDHGASIMDDSTDKVIARYAYGTTEQIGQQIWDGDILKAPGNDIVRIRSVRVLDKNKEVCMQFDVRDPVIIETEYWILQSIEPQCVTCVFYNDMGRVIFISRDNKDSPWTERNNPEGLYRSACSLPSDFLNHGMISVTVIVEPMDVIRRYPRPMVKDIIFYVTDKMDAEGTRGNYPFEWESYVAVRPRLNWTVEKLK